MSWRTLKILIASSGLKVREEDELKLKAQGNEKRSGWIKLHIAADLKIEKIIAKEITTLPKMIDNSLKRLQKAFSDGGCCRSSY